MFQKIQNPRNTVLLTKAQKNQIMKGIKTNGKLEYAGLMSNANFKLKIEQPFDPLKLVLLVTHLIHFRIYSIMEDFENNIKLM
jgi:hypothetical protein